MRTAAKIVLVVFISLVLAKYIVAQDCEAYFPMKEGAYLEMKNYNDKDKLLSTGKYTVLKKETSDNTVTVTVDVKSYDDKDKEEFDRQVSMMCKDGVFYIDMDNFMDPQTMESYKDTEVKMASENLEMPAHMEPGQTLKDGSLTMTMQMGPREMVALAVKIFNRKVDAIENVTTPAGTFSCLKISQDVETKTMFKMTSNTVSWYAKDVGVVRSETYNSKGKLTGYSVLTDFKE
jgi:hypothetical protein